MEASSLKKQRTTDWWLNDDGLFNIDEEGRAEKQLCAVAASNVIRNFSFMPDNEQVMAQHRHCIETMFQCIEDQNTGITHLLFCSLVYACFIASLLLVRLCLLEPNLLALM